ncbi:MAG: hypothetical protein IPM82_26185 [Saprospiraceae bacterium]|nr:hypothetical protein [Saprospiraceae bacterium]
MKYAVDEYEPPFTLKWCTTTTPLSRHRNHQRGRADCRARHRHPIWAEQYRLAGHHPN